MTRVGAVLAGLAVSLTSIVMTPAQAATAALPGEHRVYVVYVTGSGDLQATPEALAAGVDQALARWVQMAPSGFTSFARVGAPVPYAAPAPGTPGCGVEDVSAGFRRDAFAQVEQAVGMGHAPPGVAEHLVLLMPSSCFRGYVPGDSGTGPYTNFGGTRGASFDAGGDIVAFEGQYFPSTPDDMGRTLVPYFGANLGFGPSGLGCVPPGSGWTVCHPDWINNGSCYSPMGMMSGMSLSTAERAGAGILETGEVLLMDGSHGPVDQVVTLQPRGSGAGLRGAAIADPETGETYYLDYRADGGLDHARYAWPGCADGIVVTVPGATRGTMVLPPVPAQPIGYSRAAWQAGETIPLSGAVRLDVLSFDPASGAQVRVRISPGPAFDRVGKLSYVGEMAQTAAVTVKATGFSPAPERVSYRWYGDGQLITDAYGNSNSSEFIIIPDDVRSLTVEVTAYHAGRSYAVARRTWPVAKNLVRVSRHPLLRGRFAVGHKVTTFFHHAPEGPGRLKVRYAYYADGRLIVRSRHKSLRLPAAVAGKHVTVVVTVTGREVTKAVRTSRPSPSVRG